MSAICRLGSGSRWSDVVIYRGVARWVEVAEDRAADFGDQARQVLRQVDETLQSLSTDRTALLQLLVFMTDLQRIDEFNAVWDSWVPSGAAPIRACMQAGLSGGCQIEVIVEAAVSEQ
ncbi:MAG: putative aminoacrylate peracid reductase RutC [Planctomycetota bacterium]